MLIGCDTGGTFTDFVMFDPAHPERGLLSLKLSSTPDDPSRAVLDGLARLCQGVLPEQVNHATTVATNALLEGQGGRVAFLTTKGFGEMLWLGRGNRSNLYALAPSRVEPPVLREDCQEVAERVLADGTVQTPLTPEEIARATEGLAPEVDAVAICLLHSSLNPDHEEQLREHLAARFPRVFCSHRLSPGSGEYERGMTCLLAAYLSPRVESYLNALSQALEGSQLRIVHSAGGLLTPRESKELPHRLALSGPAAGLRGALALGLESGEPNLVTLDMGGTSTDVALLAQGELPYSWQTALEGFPLRAPTLDIHTIGAGGGSIAYTDGTGLLRVGPRSAGAVPGPVCYRRGGSDPTVTDALCHNGYLPQNLGDDALTLDREASCKALARLGDRLELAVQEVADGVLEIAASHLAGAVRKVTTGNGQDPTAFTLFPFGGAGPLLACAVAEHLEMERILVPSCAGVLSAWGALSAPWEREWSWAVPPMFRTDESQWHRMLGLLKMDARREFSAARDMVWTGLVARRYRGQGETLVSEPELDFHELHQAKFGFHRPDTPVQAVEVRIRATRAPLQGLAQFAARDCSSAASGHQTVRWKGQALEVPVYQEPCGFLEPTPGPLLVFQNSSTLFVAPGWRAQTLSNGHLLLIRGQDE
jgi:N-methylhydantoinase A